MKVTVIANAHKFGGGERSVLHIMKMMRDRGIEIRFIPTQTVCQEFIVPAGVNVAPSLRNALPQHTDVLLLYANNFVTANNRDGRRRLIEHTRYAGRKVLVLNFRIGWANETSFASLWDKVGFLNTTTESQWKHAVPGPTFVLPSPVDISPFLPIEPDYSLQTAVRHSHPSKYRADAAKDLLNALQQNPDLRFDLMGVPPSVQAVRNERLVCRPYASMPVPEYLRRGSLFWHSLHAGVVDQGPRTVIEAMAAGLACIVDDCDGAAERVTPECGWKCRTPDDFLNAFREIRENPGLLKIKGQAAKARAASCFRPERWLEEIFQLR
jgi:glycosyltransferase involved in cell wall biosynthesis